MLQKYLRLKRMKDFEILFKEGVYFNSEKMSLKIWKIDPAKYPKREYGTGDLKIGFTVGLKVSKSAVKRNRLKRQMREVVRLLLKDEKIKSGYMALFVAKPQLLGCDFEEIEKNIIFLFKKSGLLK